MPCFKIILIYLFFPLLDVMIRRDGRYDLADFFYKQAYKEEIVGHWQVHQQQLSESGPGRHVGLETVDGTSKLLSPGAGGVQTGVMDLHGFSLPLAHAAVRFDFVRFLFVGEQG